MQFLTDHTVVNGEFHGFLPTLKFYIGNLVPYPLKHSRIPLPAGSWVPLGSHVAHRMVKIGKDL